MQAREGFRLIVPQRDTNNRFSSLNGLQVLTEQLFIDLVFRYGT
jgi:hypothetical protein